MKYTVVVAEDEELLLNNLVQKIHCPDRRAGICTGRKAYS